MNVATTIVKVKIVKCSNPDYWYKDQVGNHYFVYRTLVDYIWARYYRIVDSPYYQNDLLHPDDVEVLPVTGAREKVLIKVL